LRRYLTGEFGAAVADRSVRQIVADISGLKRHPNLLRSLAGKIGRPTDFRYYLCGRYSLAISLLDVKTISIVRILDSRSDYATAVFGAETNSARDEMRRRRSK